MSKDSLSYEALLSFYQDVQKSINVAEQKVQECSKRKRDVSTRSADSSSETDSDAESPQTRSSKRQKKDPKEKKVSFAKKEGIKIELPCEFKVEYDSPKLELKGKGTLLSVKPKKNGKNINYEVDIKAGRHKKDSETFEEWCKRKTSYKSLTSYFRERFDHTSGDLYKYIILSNGMSLDECRKKKVTFINTIEEKQKAKEAAEAAAEAAKIEAAKVKAAVEAAVEAAKVEAAKVEAAKVEAAKVEAAKVEAAKVEAAKVEASIKPAQEIPKAEAQLSVPASVVTVPEVAAAQS